ncbi:MAG: phosphoenolpyruvate--protein phosphotransferase [Ruminococcaceae bacterium]|mgnify:CR=1 FL=1|nr:phosphoenolpyruvate--protein phosphotransferase [Oscillospiraceae bacterium]
MVFKGIGASPGIGKGRVFLVRAASLDYSAVPFSGAQAERKRLGQAVEACRAATATLALAVRREVGEDIADILTAQAAMLEDPTLKAEALALIDAGMTAEAAVDTVSSSYVRQFLALDNELMRQRAADVQDMRRRLLEQLLGLHQADITAAPQGSVLVAEDVSPSMAARIQKTQIVGIAAETGGKTGHTAILARALGIPAVVGVPGIATAAQPGDDAIVDGDAGRVLLRPEPAAVAEYQHYLGQQAAEQQQLWAWRSRPTATADGQPCQVWANIAGVPQARDALDAGAEGIGLFRTEFLFMQNGRLPTEAEQLACYSAAADVMPGQTVVIRTLDVGGDKAIDYLGIEKEANPYLGFRAIRYCLDHPELFSVQLRALLRAGARHGNVAILLPMITGLEEVRATRRLLDRCKQQLEREGLPYDNTIRLGAMIETPAAALLADRLATEVDFLSIGTNDLAQYTLAADRGNPRVENLNNPFHPALLRSLQQVAAVGNAAGIPVELCGEAAADPAMVPLLLAFGVQVFSVAPAAVPATRRAIARYSLPGARALAQAALLLDTATEVEAYLRATCAGEA